MIMFTLDLAADGGRQDWDDYLASRVWLLADFPLRFSPRRRVHAILQPIHKQEQQQRQAEGWAAVHWATVFRAP